MTLKRRLPLIIFALVGAVLLTSCAFEPFAKIPFSVKLTTAVNLPIAGEPTELITADFNGDGHLDLVTLHLFKRNIVFHAGDGLGGFESQSPIVFNPDPIMYRIADINGDDLSDLLVLVDESYEMAMLLGSEEFGLVLSTTVPLVHESLEEETEQTMSGLENVTPEHGGFGEQGRLHSFTYGDYDDDGNLDFVIGYQDGEVELFKGNGDKTFEVTEKIDTELELPELESLDLNNDNFDDLIVFGNLESLLEPGQVDGSKITIYYGSANGFSEEEDMIVRVTSGTVGSLMVHDFDRDGFEDLVVGFSGNGTVSVIPNSGIGSFDDMKNYLVKTASGISLADMDNDGDNDLIISQSRGEFNTGVVQVFLNAGDYRLRAPESFEVRIGPRSLVSGDFNEDGLPDIAVINQFSSDLSLIFNETGSAELDN